MRIGDGSWTTVGRHEAAPAGSRAAAGGNLGADSQAAVGRKQPAAAVGSGADSRAAPGGKQPAAAAAAGSRVAPGGKLAAAAAAGSRVALGGKLAAAAAAAAAGSRAAPGGSPAAGEYLRRWRAGSQGTATAGDPDMVGRWSRGAVRPAPPLRGGLVPPVQSRGSERQQPQRIPERRRRSGS
jgi:hypothetical protein